MIYGHVRDYMPRVSLVLRGRDGSPITVEFVLDTAFDEELSIPTWLLGRLDCTARGEQLLEMADGTRRRTLLNFVALNWHDKARRTQVVTIEGNPLVGAVLLADSRVTLDMIDGGEFIIEPI